MLRLKKLVYICDLSLLLLLLLLPTWLRARGCVCVYISDRKISVYIESEALDGPSPARSQRRRPETLSLSVLPGNECKSHGGRRRSRSFADAMISLRGRTRVFSAIVQYRAVEGLAADA